MSLRRADGTPTPTGRAVISPARVSDLGLGPTVEVPTPRLGPSVEGSPVAANERVKKRSRAAAAASSLLLGVVGAALYMKLGLAGSDAAPVAAESARHGASPRGAPLASLEGGAGASAAAAQSAQAPALARLLLSTNAPSARFLVDGEELAGGELVGRTGERVRVRVEATGFEPLHADVVFDGSLTRRFELVPAPALAPSTRASSSPRVEHPRPPTAKATPAPSAGGVAPGLTLRKE